MEKKIVKRLALVLCVLVAASVALFFYALHELNRYAATPASPGAEAETFEVAAGQGVSEIARRLAAAGLIRRPVEFRLFARVRGFDKRIDAGEYRLSPAMTPFQIIGKMARGEVILHRLTIPEGYTMLQIADLVAKAGICGRKAFIRELTDPVLLRRDHIPAHSFEGYLFPDTYFFPKNTSPKKVIDTLVSRFWTVFTPKRRARAAQIGLSVHQVVTLASMIVKETGNAAERAIISSVFHNRLKRGMRLESDPTVIYGIKNFNGKLTRKDLTTPTPYNTYRIRGLPPGPIANPGEASIDAALYPAHTPYLYFVARNDGTHHFSTNIRDHDRAVAKYQLK